MLVREFLQKLLGCVAGHSGPCNRRGEIFEARKVEENSFRKVGVLYKNDVDRGAFRKGGKKGNKEVPATQAVVLNQGVGGRQSQSLAGGGREVLNFYQDKPVGCRAY